MHFRYSHISPFLFLFLFAASLLAKFVPLFICCFSVPNCMFVSIHFCHRFFFSLIFFFFLSQIMLILSLYLFFLCLCGVIFIGLALAKSTSMPFYFPQPYAYTQSVAPSHLQPGSEIYAGQAVPYQGESTALQTHALRDVAHPGPASKISIKSQFPSNTEDFTD